MSTGTILDIDQDWRSGTLAVAATATDTVLQLDNAIDFDEGFAERRYLVGGDETTPREYVATDKAADTVTLAAPVGGTGLEVDLPVVLWDPTVGTSGAKAVEYVASVRLSDGSGEPPAVIPHELIPAAGVDALVGASVEIEEDASGDWYVVQVFGREPALDAAYTYLPRISAAKGADDPIASGAWTPIGGWFTLASDRIAVDPTGKRFTVLVDGEYDIRVGVTFSPGGGGSRAVLIHYYGVLGEEAGVSRMVKYPSDGTTSVETAQIRGLYGGMSIEFEAWQNSGASLNIRGSNVFTSPPLTDCSIRWAGPR